MGRGEGSLTAAQILYPIMQCTDIFFLKADVCQVRLLLMLLIGSDCVRYPLPIAERFRLAPTCLRLASLIASSSSSASCQLGVDQRKVNMLAREYCDAAGIKLKPIILSHHMLYGLAKGQVLLIASDYS